MKRWQKQCLQSLNKKSFCKIKKNKKKVFASNKLLKKNYWHPLQLFPVKMVKTVKSFGT